jgi:hypothetical protein
MPGLEPGIPVFASPSIKTWMAGAVPGWNPGTDRTREPCIAVGPGRDDARRKVIKLQNIGDF